MCVQNIMGIFAKLRGLDAVQRSLYTLLIPMRRRVQTNKKHIGPHIHVGPNYFYRELNIIIEHYKKNLKIR